MVLSISSEFVNCTYSMSRLETRLFFLLVSRLPSSAMGQSTLSVSLSRSDLVKAMGGKSINSTQLKMVARSLSKRSFAFGSYLNWEFVSLSSLKYERGSFTAVFPSQLFSHFIGLDSRFTKLPLDLVFSLNSPFALRLYLLLSEYFNFGFRKFIFNSDFLNQFELASSYKTFAIFKKNLLLPALSDISLLSDLDISEVTYSRDATSGRALDSFKIFVNSSTGSLKSFVETVRELYTSIDLYKSPTGMIFCSPNDGLLKYSDTFDTLPPSLAKVYWRDMFASVQARTDKFLPFVYPPTEVAV